MVPICPECTEIYLSYRKSISILSYIAIILFYTLMKELKNLSSKTIVALCATLLFADTTFLVATQHLNNKLACKVIAIILHWALLSAQVWTAVIAFDLLSRFGSVALALRKKSSIRFCRYCLVAYLLPLIILVLTVTLNETSTYDIGYGKRNTCFIYNFYPKLYFYIIPFAIAFVSTVLCFIFTIFFIWKQEDKIRKSLKDSERSNRGITCIALKLIVALGIIEVVGLIQISKSSFSQNDLVFNSVFSVTYPILRSFRGVILCLIYGKSEENIKKLKSLTRKITLMRTSSTKIRNENTGSTKPWIKFYLFSSVSTNLQIIFEILWSASLWYIGIRVVIWEPILISNNLPAKKVLLDIRPDNTLRICSNNNLAITILYQN